MFHHVVMFTFVEGTEEGTIEAIVDALRQLPAAIPEISSYLVGRDAGLAPGNAELVVVGSFADEAAYLRYRDHPVHQQVVTELIRPAVATRSAIQFAS